MLPSFLSRKKCFIANSFSNLSYYGVSEYGLVNDQ